MQLELGDASRNLPYGDVPTSVTKFFLYVANKGDI